MLEHILSYKGDFKKLFEKIVDYNLYLVAQEGSALIVMWY